MCLEECRLKELMEVYDSFRLHSSSNAPSSMQLPQGALNSSTSLSGQIGQTSPSMPSTPTTTRSMSAAAVNSMSNSASSTAAMTATALAQASGVLRQNSLGAMSASDVATVAAMYNQLTAYNAQHRGMHDIG